VADSGAGISSGIERHPPNRRTLWDDASGCSFRAPAYDPPVKRAFLDFPLTSLSSGRDALLEGSILGLPGLIEEKPAEQARSRPGSRAESRVPTDRAKYGAAAGADGRSGQRALLGRGHVGTSTDRESSGR
jgi:hypothetical protein